MAKQSLKEEIMEVIRESTETEVDFNEETHLIEGLGLASIEVMVLLSDLESEFGVDIPKDQLLRVKTVGDLLEAVEAQM